MVDIDFLHPTLREKYLKLCDICKSEQLSFELVSTYHTKQEQNILYSKGRFGAGNVCTNKRYPYSYHNWGLAFDINTDDETLEKIVKIAKSLDISWNDDTDEGCVDNKYHFYLPLFPIEDLVAIYSQYDDYRATWNAAYAKPSMITSSIMELANRKTIYITQLQHACITDKISTPMKQGVMVTGKLDAITIAAIKNIKIKFLPNKYYAILQFVQKLLVRNGYDITVDGTMTSNLMCCIRNFECIHDLDMSKTISEELILFLLAKMH